MALKSQHRPLDFWFVIGLPSFESLTLKTCWASRCASRRTRTSAKADLLKTVEAKRCFGFEAKSSSHALRLSSVMLAEGREDDVRRLSCASRSAAAAASGRCSTWGTVITGRFSVLVVAVVADLLGVELALPMSCVECRRMQRAVGREGRSQISPSGACDEEARATHRKGEQVSDWAITL